MKSIGSRLQSACCLECSMTWQIVPGSPLNRECASLSDKMAPAHRPKHTGQSFAFQSYGTNSRGPTLVYFWAFPDTSELSLCTTNSCLSRMLPFSLFFAPPSPVLRLCFHLVLKCAPRFLSPVRHVDLSQGRARKAYWSMAVLETVKNFSICSNFIYFQLTSLWD